MLADPPWPIPVVDGLGKVAKEWEDYFRQTNDLFETTFSGTVTLAKLTPAGTNGALVIRNGIITSVTQPT